MTERVVTTAKKPETKHKCSNSCKQNPRFNSSGSPADRVLKLQKTAGNQAVQKLIKSRTLQAKLRVGQPNDVYEQEADRMAEQVMSIPDTVLQHKYAKCNEGEKKVLQAKESLGQVPITHDQEVPFIVHEVLSSPEQPLDPVTRAFMESRFGHDFSQVRVHSDAKAADSAQAANALAYTVGQDIAFGAEQYMPQTNEGRRLIAHELVHVVQQTDSNGAVRNPMMQRHASYEHRLLGDMPTADLDAAVNRISPKQRQHVLALERSRLKIWQKNPEQVTEAQVRANWPDVRIIRLANGLILTYGELNSLPDYMPNPQAIDTADRNVVLPILQTIRQQSFNRLTDLIGATRIHTTTINGGPVSYPVPDYKSFEGAVGPVGERGTVADIEETLALYFTTRRQDTNQYTALLSRNACHFAPFSWHRWQEFHTQARDKATQGYTSSSKDLIRQAWLYNGYADHFLQDSFAAGHLINKTLIMQWFVEWVEQYNAGTKWYERNIHIANWDQIRTMTTREQPGIAGRHLYGGMRGKGASTDPQTTEEQATLESRMRASGVQGTSNLAQEKAYQNYLAFLNSMPVQQASKAVHDYFNENSLWVSSVAYPKAYRIWGDENMMTSGEGVRIASETAKMSQQAIQDLTTTGHTSPEISIQQIRDRFPSVVRTEDGRELPLENWNESLRELCFTKIFPEKVKYRLLSECHMHHVSVDQ